MNIFVVENRFAWPIDTTQAPPQLGDLSAQACAACHQSFYDEWQTTIHAQAWTDPCFQVDWKFDDSQHVCRLCHTPLDTQQPYKVLGYRDKDKWDPIAEDNPKFSPKLQHEGVTCAACHYRAGKIVGVLGIADSPHPLTKLSNPNEICVRCHIVEGERWDTFFRFPPCGTVAEIAATRIEPQPGNGGEASMPDIGSLGCVECHMPLMRRPLVDGGKLRDTRQHLWRGGHDPAMVKKALTVKLVETNIQDRAKRSFTLTLVNTGAAHYLPTGTPDRHLTVQLWLLDSQGEVVEEKNHTLKRRIMWRPFIIDLWDNRLPRGQARHYQIDAASNSTAVVVQAVVRYHLLEESRRQRIGYENETPIHYEIFRKEISLQEGKGEAYE